MATLLVASILTSEVPPVEFRCDALKVDSGPGQCSCKGNVVVVRGPVLMCCDAFQAQANKDWQWETFQCSGNVRAQRGNEFVWADHATFSFGESLITLNGGPLLRRGRSLMTGQRVTIDLKNDQAQVTSPRGRITQETDADKRGVDAPELRSECPIPARPTF